MLTWKTVDRKAIYPLERYHAVSGSHEYRIFYGLKAANQDRPWVLVIREVGMACTRMCTIHRTADEAKKSRRAMGRPATARVTGRIGDPI